MRKNIGVLLLLCVYLAGCSGKSNNSNEPNSLTVNKEISENTETEESREMSIEDSLLFFVNKFNENNDMSLEYVEDFVPSDNSSSHYRTEFRLAAYENALGKSYLFESAKVDIVVTDDYFGKIETRVYMDNATIEQCADMIRRVSPIMDATVSNDEIQNTINYITENKEANGYYYADLGLTLLGNDEKGYELMIKND